MTARPAGWSIRRVSWNRRYRARRFAVDSLWLLPLLGAAAGLLLSALVAGPGEQIDMPQGWHYSATTASRPLADERRRGLRLPDRVRGDGERAGRAAR